MNCKEETKPTKVDRDVLVEVECKYCGSPLRLLVCERSRAVEMYGTLRRSVETSNFTDSECRSLGVDPEQYRGAVYTAFSCCSACRRI